MPLPSEFNTIEVIQDYVTFQGNISAGTVTFEPPNTFFLAEDSDVAITPKAIVGTLDATGRMRVVLPFTDDPDIIPSFNYHVTERIDGLQRETDVQIPIGLGNGPVKLYDLLIVGEPVITGDNLLTKAAADLLYQAKIDVDGPFSDYADVENLPGYPIAFPPIIGSGADQAVAGSDSRLSDMRTPTDNSVSNAKLVNGSVTDAKVSTTAGINLDKTADSANRLAFTPTERTKLGTIADGATANASNAQLRDRATHTGVQTASTISDLTEAVQDIIGIVFSGGNVTATYNDAAGTITLTAPTGSTFDPEATRDAIGAALIGVGVITVTVNDAADTITISSTATTNSTDAFLLSRTNHTGTQAISTVTNLQSSLDAKANVVVTTTTKTGTTYTFALVDSGTIVELNNAAANTATVPLNSVVAFPVGTVIGLRQYGAGQTTIAADAGVTIRSRGSALKLTGQYAEATLTKRATDEWILTGDVMA